MSEAKKSEKVAAPKKLDEKSLKELLEALDAVEIIGVASGKIIGDKKVNGKDIPYVIEFVKKFDSIANGIKGINDIKLKDLSYEQALEVIFKLCGIFKKIQEAIAIGRNV